MNVTHHTVCLMVYYTFCFNYTQVAPTVPQPPFNNGITMEKTPLPPASFLPPLDKMYQHLTQDSLGQYTYGYSTGTSAKVESRKIDGTTVGGYSYIDPNGEIQTIQYTADADGFRAYGSNIPRAPSALLPKPVEDTPEVSKAKDDHFNYFDRIKNRNENKVSYVPRGHYITPLAHPQTFSDAKSSAGIDTNFKLILDEDTVEVGGDSAPTRPGISTGAGKPPASYYPSFLPRPINRPSNFYPSFTYPQHHGGFFYPQYFGYSYPLAYSHYYTANEISPFQGSV